MDVLDAGVYVSKWDAVVPKHTKTTLWGPLAAKEMGLDGWEVQDGGETGFVMHNPGVKLTMGRATSTLIFVRRLERAFLTIYFGGYPTDAPGPQRKLDMQKVVGACEIFLSRLAKEKVKFDFQGELTLVDNANDPPAKRVKGASVEPKALGGGKLSRSGDIIDADEELRGRRTRSLDSASQEADEELAKKAGYVSVTEAKKPKAKAKAVDADEDADEEEPAHVQGAPSWARVPKGKAKVIDADVVAKKTGGKGKNEVWEV